jgi:integrase
MFTFDTVSEDDMRRAAVPKGQAGEQPTTESGTVVPFPGSQGDDAAFITGIRSTGATAYREVVARLQSTRLQSTDDDDGEAAADTAPKRRRAPVEGEDRRQYLTEREVEQLCDAARKRGRYGHRDATMILIAYRHGLRVSELVALQWDQVDGYR